MKFVCKWSGAIYIVRPTVRGVNHLGIVSVQPGLRAMFDRETQVFDSVKAQEEHNWTDEERVAVEKYLLKSKDYGNGLRVYPGEEIPEELQGEIRADAPKTAPLCDHVDWDPERGQVYQCDKDALPGDKKCEKHREKKSEVIRGMLGAG